MHTIGAGVIVRVKTTNGGEIIATLLENYRNTYDVMIEVHNLPVVIPAYRLKSVEPIDQGVN